MRSQALTTSVGALVALLAFASPRPARAEYVENTMGRDLAAMTLIFGGTTAVAFDVPSAIYVADGPDDRNGRVVAGVGSMVAGTVVVAGSVLALATMGEEHIPPGDGAEERQALTTGRWLSGVGIALGLASFGIGIASVATHRDATSEPSAERAQPCMWTTHAGRGPSVGFVMPF